MGLDAEWLGNRGSLFTRPSLLEEGGRGCTEWEDDADYEINGNAWSRSAWGRAVWGGGGGRGGVLGLGRQGL